MRFPTCYMPQGRKNGWIRLLGLMLILPALALTSGCEQDNSDLEEFIDAVKAKPATDIPPIPDIAAYQPFDYPAHQRDPFDESVLAAKLAPDHRISNNIRIDRNRPKEYLEGFPLDSLRMVGTLSQGGQLWGLIKTPDGTIQRVRVGNYMGQNHGKITQITENSIKLTEIAPDGYGGFIKRPASVALKTP